MLGVAAISLVIIIGVGYWLYPFMPHQAGWVVRNFFGIVTIVLLAISLTILVRAIMRSGMSKAYPDDKDEPPPFPDTDRRHW